MLKLLHIILAAVALDAVGLGLMFPILPDLLRELTGSRDITGIYGLTLALFALMQFGFSPTLGTLSDRFGRRPVLLISIAGATIDYLVMAFVPSLWVVLVGRAIAGLKSANMAVATAYISDISTGEERAKRFGQMGAFFGIGFIVGPALGGVLGQWWLHAPFLAAALLNGLNFCVAMFVLPESRKPNGGRIELASLNPLAPLRWVLGFRALLPLIAIFFVLGLVGSVPGTVWVLYGQDRFHWDGITVGLSLTTFGLFMVGAQALVTGPATKWLGELRALVVSMFIDGAGMALMAFATRGWMPFALAPFFALGGIAQPAVQSLMSQQASEDRQGELQGVLASVNSLTAIVGPVVGTAIYATTWDSFSGAVWLVGAALYLLALPALAMHRRASLTLQPAE